MPLKNPYETLLRISEEINTVHDIDALLERIMDRLLEALEAERGFILLRNEGEGGRFEAVTARNISKESIDSIRDLSSSVVNQVLDSGEAVLSLDAQADQRFAGAESIVMHQIKSVMCTPLKKDDRLLGAIYVDSRVATRQFDEQSLTFLKAFAGQAAIAISNARMLNMLQNENRVLRRQMNTGQLFPEIIGKSKPMQQIFDMIRDVADSTASVLITGESGTGKELVARALHVHSSRSNKPFIPVFCGSLAENLLESELFGHKKGAFTGATEGKIGLFEEAHQGTIFLDEIADISMNLQTKLLRVLQEGEVKRVGDNQLRKVDVRVLSATNKDLWKEVEQGNFREDLYFRLNVIEIHVPALRERREDIPLLCEHFLKIYAQKNKRNIKRVTPEALRLLQEYHWPGNVRELENAMERAVILARGTEIGPEHFRMRKSAADIPIGKTLKEINKYAILKTLELVEGNNTRAAEILGVSRRWLQYQLKEWGMVRGN
ncbi:MAG TPA: sigma-54-dependent Fis family transcriptional regulator [Caldithrix abyssi]|uniref:Sigma-54-dependent Fis family transcriptional regulator n=1 Tax=Caldithrix abyssi TaxID=187145 RepID=A0A7V4U0V8_CALAY|nr:sigma-54-dependent Fis family transcriptional regulator [Caldithrix abyssi]